VTVGRLIDRLLNYARDQEVIVVDCKHDEAYEALRLVFHDDKCLLLVDSEYKESFQY